MARAVARPDGIIIRGARIKSSNRHTENSHIMGPDKAGVVIPACCLIA